MSFVARPGNSPRWADDLPEGWTADWVKWSVAFASAKPDGDDIEKLPYISNEDITSWTGKLLKEDPEPADKEGRLFRRGDVLFNKLRPYLAKVYQADFDGISSGELLNLRASERVLPRFLFHVLSSYPFIDIINSESFGTKMPRADWETVGHQPLPLPDLDTQRRIAGYLDDKTARIDALIEKKRALLDRLAEKRQALITRAVTRGLNPDAPLKDSGIDWLGKVPAHWEVKRFRFVLQGIEQGWSPQCDNRQAQQDEWGVLKVGCVNGMAYDESEHKALPSDLDPITKYEVRVGDVLLSRANTKELLGSASLVHETRGRMIFNDKLYRLNLADELVPEYAITVLQSPLARLQYERDATGTSGSMQNIGQDTIKNLLMPIPPSDEQISIGQHVADFDRRLTSMIERIQESVAQLNEYRAALVTAAVTGKIKALLAEASAQAASGSASAAFRTAEPPSLTPPQEAQDGR